MAQNHFALSRPPAARPATAPTALINELAAALERRTLMQFGAERRDLLIATLASHAIAAGERDVAAYASRVLSSGGESAMLALVDALTINETTFFRNVPQLEMFARVALPEIMARKRDAGEPKQLKIWSAGCSTGQEAYTLAMLADDATLAVHAWDVKILGTDISPTVVEAARRGSYPKARLDTMPPSMRTRYFDEPGDQIRVKDTLRRRVSFEQHNLNNPFPAGPFDVIFCRNVMIYFSRAEQARLALRFKDRLAPEGFLFIGHSESFQGLDVGLRLRMHKGGVAYQK
jgi:chemotaxis protein methyltransferase CheR